MNLEIAAALKRAREDANYGFDTLRDELAALPESALPDLLIAALDPANTDLLGQVAAALCDTGWPGAYDAFVKWVTGEDAWIAVDAGCALAAAGGGGFDFWGQVAPGDQPQPEKVRAVAPALVTWWERTGQKAAPDVDAWRETLGRAPTREERVYALVRSSAWAVLGDGRAVETDLPLPRNAGTHYTGGVVVVEGVGEVDVAFVLDSAADDPIVAVMAESQQGWINIAARTAERRPRHTVGDSDADDLAARYEVGPTGSLRERPSK